MTQRTEAFPEIPFSHTTALTVMRRMLEAIGIHLSDASCVYQDEQRFNLPYKKPMFKLTMSFTFLQMPCLTVTSCNDAPLAIMEFDDHGIIIERHRFIKKDGVIIFDPNCLEMCGALINLMLQAAKDYIQQHLTRFMSPA